MHSEGRYWKSQRHENRGYKWGFLPRNPFAQDRGRQQHGHDQGYHIYNLSTVASGATWFVACMFIFAVVNMDWAPDPVPQSSPSIDIEPIIIHQQEFKLPPGQKFILANDSSIHVSPQKRDIPSL